MGPLCSLGVLTECQITIYKFQLKLETDRTQTTVRLYNVQLVLLYLRSFSEA